MTCRWRSSVGSNIVTDAQGTGFDPGGRVKKVFVAYLDI